MNQRIAIYALAAIGIAACSTSGNSSSTNNPLAGVTLQVATPTPTPSPRASATPAVTPTPTVHPTASPMPTPTLVGATPPPVTPTPLPTPTQTPTSNPNILIDGGFETEGAANMTLTAWTPCSYVHPIANGTPAATPIPAIAAGSVTADVISTGSPSFTVGSYPGASGSPTPTATVVPAPNSGSYAALVFTGTGAIIDTFAPHTGPEAAPIPAGVDGICQSFVVPQNGLLTAYVEEGGYESASTSTKTYGDQEADIFAGPVSNVASEQPTLSLFNELNTQMTAGYTPAYVQKGPYDLIAMGFTPGQTVTLLFGTYDTSPSHKYGEYMFVDDVAVSGTPLATMSVRPPPASLRRR